eukprot:CAMPEP_0194143522 /NCGR_PEP_ID=MMETSP0152-20130528/12686_1 /TAXON_ID=1049557 /ORGANISM="Thalassiothrix antarctica, Strain L6-D1" /LENGTH=638 /DNA_ID=CAMNT_0038842979 /DNA_START=132 /DNA_END=2048 /DNA_ORIENTATION=-
MADQARKARAAALEDKKRRLEDLKARRARRETTPNIDKPKPSKNLNEYIDGLLKQSAPNDDNNFITTTISSLSSQQQQLNNGGTTTEEDNNTVSCGTSISNVSEDISDNNNSNNNSLSTGGPLSLATRHQYQIPKVAKFEFGTQTLEEDFFIPAKEEEEDTSDENNENNISKGGEDFENDDNNNDGDDSGNNKDGTKNGKSENIEDIASKILSSEEKEEAVSKVSFSSFLNSASKKVERILGEPVLADLLVNFVGETDGKENEDAANRDDGGGRYVSARQVFEHSKWTMGRCVTDMDWSPLHRELMLGSYDMPTNTTTTSSSSGLLSAVKPNERPSSSLVPLSGELKSDGLTLVWNLAMPSRPEHIFTCGSPVLSARFHPTESPLVIGGCHSGQLVIWDVRTGRLPVQRSGQGYPICGMQVTEKPAGLVTASTDGKVSFWSLANLRDPAETVELRGNLSSLGTAPSNAVFCGDESGCIFHVPVKRKQSKRLPNPNHFGMVTAVSVKKKLVLSSGVDWTVRLTKNGKTIWDVTSNSYEYMSDVQWSPVHPSLFATASSDGVVRLWNFAESIEQPQAEIVVERDDDNNPIGLNKIRWSADGKRLLVAAGERIHIISLTEDTAIRQKEEDEDRMLNRLFPL